MDWQSVGMASGAALLGASGLQAIGAALLGRRRLRTARRRYANRRAAFNQQLQAVFQWARAARPVFKAWTGTRSFRVAAVVDEAADCKSFYLSPVDGRPLPRFEPGQYLTFNLPADPRSRPLVRCYSLSDRPREDYYRITIKRAGPPVAQAHLPPGQGSNFFHGRVAVGATLDVQAPQGAFFLDPTDEMPVVLVGGGIGITPILSMANSIVHERSARKAYLFAGFRNSREHPFHERIESLKKHDSLQVDVSYSRPMPGDVVSRDYDHRGRIGIARLRQVLPSSNFRFYVCGPAGMMESLVPALLEWRVPQDHIHFEAFGPASVKGLSGLSSSATGTAPCNVDFSRTNASLTWTGEHASLLDFAESQKIALDYGCRAGNCGQCLLEVRRGKFDHVKEPGLPLDDNHCLACIAVPQGDLVLEA